MIKIILKSLGCAAIPFILLGSGWAWGFVTRSMIDWNALLLAAIFTSIVVFGLSLLLFTAEGAEDIEESRRNFYVIAILVTALAMLMAPLSYLYEADEAKQAKKVAERLFKKERKVHLILQINNIRLCMYESKKGDHYSAEILECQP